MANDSSSAPITERFLHRAISSWIQEELEEFRTAQSTATELDALWDLTGVCLLGIATYTASAISSSYTEYAMSQTRRGRPSLMHQAVLHWWADLSSSMPPGTAARVFQAKAAKARGEGRPMWMWK
jgi:hypothetical protein